MQHSACPIDLAQAVNIALLAIQTGALGVLVWYSFETRSIKRASIAQAEATHQPCLLLPPVLTEQMMAVMEATTEGIAPTCALADPVVLRNVGPGPALSIRYWASGGDIPGTRLASYSVPHLPSGHSVQVAIPSAFLRRGNVVFVAEYASISGVHFRSEVTLEQGRILTFALAKAPAT